MERETYIEREGERAIEREGERESERERGTFSSNIMVSNAAEVIPYEMRSTECCSSNNITVAYSNNIPQSSEAETEVAETEVALCS